MTAEEIIFDGDALVAQDHPLFVNILNFLVRDVCWEVGVVGIIVKFSRYLAQLLDQL